MRVPLSYAHNYTRMLHDARDVNFSSRSSDLLHAGTMLIRIEETFKGGGKGHFGQISDGCITVTYSAKGYLHCVSHMPPPSSRVGSATSPVALFQII